MVALLAISGCDRSAESSGSSMAATSTAPPASLGQLEAKLVSQVIIEATGDTFVRSLTPNQNMGGDTRLSIQPIGTHRSLVFFDPTIVRQRVGSGTVLAARLELTLSSVSATWTQTGRPIAIHRLRQASNAQQATWSCALDANVSNFQPDCSGADAWSMGTTIAAEQPWVSPPTATVTISNGQTGIVSFDVTADAVAIASGADPGHGWLIKKVDELLPGALEFSSREGEVAPRLVLDVDGAPTGGLGPVTGSATLLATRDTDVRHLQPNQNFGGAARLRIQALGKNRGVIGFDAQALETAMGGPLVKARLRLPIAETSIGWGPDRAVGVHRLRRSWTELGATWNCGVDADPGNLAANCSGASAWSMAGPVEELAWLSPPTDTVLVANEQTGTLEFDVTRDVACALAGHASLDGWLVKKAMESQTGRIELHSRESQQAPALFLEWTNGQGVVVTPSDCDLDAPPGCTPTAPQDTTCNGVDEDCDGAMDDDFEVTESACGVGACSSTGERTCVSGQVVDSCAPGAPAADDASCNGVDEDCSGLADDDYAPVTTSCGVGQCTAAGETSCVVGQVLDSCQPGAPAPADATCDASDDDCDGTADEDYAPRVTSCGVGACVVSGATSCVSGNEVDGCVPGTPAPSDATCNGVDDDCSGVADEDYVAVNTSCGVGACRATGTTSCAQGQVSDSCQPGTPAASDPTCNLEDDDCDGQVDEEYTGSGTTCGVGACAATGVTSCVSGQVVDGCQPGTPAAADSSCDGEDDDCDGANDEDFVPACAGAARVTCAGGELQSTDCSDGNACNGAEICAGAGQCQPGTAPQVDDDDPCTTDSCDPATGVAHDFIPGCDGAPVAAGGRFETRVSVLGKVLSVSGAAVSDFSVSVYDAPASEDPRTDIAVSTAADGSFRARLAEFPETIPESEPSQHLIVKIETPSFISAMRDVYVRPGDAIDLGDIYLLGRDPKITWVGPSGGVATDSQERIEVTFPPGAVIAPTPVQITPVPERRVFPHPLPDATDTTYGMVLEPSQEFAVPVTVRVDNHLNVPTSLQIPVGVVDEENGGWEHAGLAVWDGSAFRFTLEHFSTVDCNPGRVGQLYMYETAGADSRKGQDGNCAGSSVSYGSGALRQSFALPTYLRQGREYGVTFSYDSSLTGGHRLGTGPASRNAAASGGGTTGGSGGGTGGGAVAPPSISLPIQSPTYRFQCIPNGGSGGGGCATGSSCVIGGVAIGTFSQLLRIAGAEVQTEKTRTSTTDGLSTAMYVTLPLNQDGTVPASGYFPYQRLTALRSPVVVNGNAGTCSGGGAAFGVQASVQTPVFTTLEPGPMARVSGYELLYHRRSSALGTGWGIEEVHEAFRAPNGAQIDVIHGDGAKESFFPRIEPKVVAAPTNSTSAPFARDPETGELFYVLGSVVRINDDWTTTPVTSSTGLSSVRNVAIDYVDGERRFFIANNSGLYEVGEAGEFAQLASWTSQGSGFDRPYVAAGGGAVYFTDGGTNVIRRILLSNTLRTVENISVASGGDVRVDPKAPAGQVSFDLPRGLAMGPDGALYVSSYRRHIIYRLLPGDDGLVGPESEVERVLGNGMSSFSAARGGLEPGKTFAMNQPLSMSFSEDGFLFVMNSQGIVRFDPVSQMARWFANELEQGFTFQVDSNPSFLGLDRDSVLVNNSSFITLTLTGLASEFEPRRRISETVTGLRLIDTDEDVVEDYVWSERDPNHARLVSRTGRSGEALLSVGYVQDSDRIAWLEDPTGGRFSFSYDTGGRLTMIEDAAGRVSHVSIDESNNLRELELPTGESRRFDYTGHLMVAAIDPRGEATAYAYREDGSVERVTRPGGASRQFSPAFNEPTYVGAQLVREGGYTDDRGVEHKVRVDDAGQVISDAYTADGVSYDLRQVYHGTLTGAFREDRNNNALKIARTTLNDVQLGPTLTWDAFGRPTRVSNPSAGSGLTNPGARFGVSYDANSRVSRVDPSGNIEYRIQRDANGRIQSIQDWSSGSQRVRRTDMTWRSDGQVDVLTEHATPRAHVYDPSSGNLAGWSDVTQAVSLGRDAAGNISLESDGVASVTSSYDDSNRLLSVTDALGNATLLGYDQESCGCARDELVTSFQTPDLPSDAAWRMQYDADGRLSRLTDPDGFTEQYVRTPNGDVQTTIDRLLRSTHFTYDQLGRPATRRDPANRMGVFAYPVPSGSAWSGPQLYAASPDASVAPTSLTAALGPGQYQVGVNAIPSGDGPPQIEVYRDATFELSYAHSFDNLLRFNRSRDRTGQSVASADPFGGQPTAAGAYMDSNRGYSIYSPAPLLDSYESLYPAENRYEFAALTYNDWFDVSGWEGWGNTSAYSVHGDGHTITRDGAGRITGLTQRYLTRSATGSSAVLYVPPNWTYAYDAHGYRNLVNNAAGVQDLTYDSRGLVATRTLSFQVATSPVTTITEGTFTYDYDELGRNTFLQYPDGHVRRQQYDSLGRLVSRCYEYGSGVTRCYTAEYDPVGNPILLTDPEGASVISYDELDRVVEVRRQVDGEPDEVETYDYNALGALSLIAGEPVDDERPRLDGSGNAPAGLPSTHAGSPVTLDLGGRVTALNGASLAYSKQTKLRQVVEGGVTYRQGFDYAQRRIGLQRTGSAAEAYLYDDNNIVGVMNATGLAGIQKRILYDGTDHPLWMYDNVADMTLYFELDTIGNVRRLRGGHAVTPNTTAPPADLGGYRYTAFGRLQPADDGTPYPSIGGQPYEQFLRWQGKPFINLAGGLYDFRARTWSPELGAFMELDTFGYLTSTGTLWSWPYQNPVRWRDPTGRFGIAVGVGGDAGYCFGACVGSWSGNAGTYLGTEGAGVYGTAQGGLGLGAHLGAGITVSFYSSLDAFKGTGVGGELAVGFGLISGASLMGNDSGGVISFTGGVGGGLYGGAAASYTWADGLSWEDVSDALNFAMKDLFGSDSDPCP